MSTITPRPSSTPSFLPAGRLLGLTAVVGVTLLASGCASMQSAPTTEVDALYVARVEQAARQMGTSVVWINYPQRTRAPAPATR